MQKKILGLFFLVLFLSISFFLYKLVNQKIEIKEDFAKVESPTQVKITQEPKETIWIKEMAHKDSREFILPVNELFMQIDLQGGDGGKVKSFRLVIDRADRYPLFCIVQTLSSMRLSYVVIKENKVPIVFVQEKSLEALDRVIQALEKYDIKSKIIEVFL